MMMGNRGAAAVAVGLLLFSAADTCASGHGPVFGAATPTLGRGGWSVDQAWTMRLGEDVKREQMLKTMVTFGITEVLQVSGSVPLAMSSNTVAPGRMMSAMSNDRECEGLVGYRFQRRPIGIGGRRESTLFVGGTAPLESTRNGAAAGGSVIVGASTGYASRAHYAWVGGGVQHYFSRQADRIGGTRVRTGARTVFIGPTSLLVYKAIALEGGVQFPVYQRSGHVKETARVAINVSYFFWLK